MVMRVHKNGHRYARREYSPSILSARQMVVVDDAKRRQNIRNIIVNNKNRFIFIILFVGCVYVSVDGRVDAVLAFRFFRFFLSLALSFWTHNLSRNGRNIRSFRSFMESFFLRSFLCGARKRYKCSRTHQMLCFMIASSSSSPPSLTQSTHTHTGWVAHSIWSVSRTAYQ